MDLEADTIEAMQNEEIGKIPHINPVGPIIQSGSMGTSGSECLKYWFDNQLKVLFCTFLLGVERLSFEQLNELAIYWFGNE
jgi:hydroquinone glucosyltransferase